MGLEHERLLREGTRAVYGTLYGMNKTTVYLPDDLKRELERTALASGRSAAELIREGIRLAIAQQTPPAPHSGIFESGDPLLSERVDELLAGFGSQ